MTNTRLLFVSLLYLAGCAAHAGAASGLFEGGPPDVAPDAGRDAWTDVADVDVDATPEAASDAGVACGPPTPFGQLACFGRPDAGRAGTSHRDGCDAGDTRGCYALVGETPRLWCCPEVSP